MTTTIKLDIGYSKKDIDIELKEGNLTISSKKLEEEIDENTTMVHKGISHRSFKRSFTLSDEMKVKVQKWKMECYTLH